MGKSSTDEEIISAIHALHCWAVEHLVEHVHDITQHLLTVDDVAHIYEMNKSQSRNGAFGVAIMCVGRSLTFKIANGIIDYTEIDSLLGAAVRQEILHDLKTSALHTCHDLSKWTRGCGLFSKLLVFMLSFMNSYGTLFAESEIVDGVEWTYHISDGSAVLGTNCVSAWGISYGSPAISKDTRGRIVLPVMLGNSRVRGTLSQAFSGCTNLTEVVVGEGVEFLGDAAFSGCSSLVSVSLPESLRSIGSSAFASTGLRAVVLPSGVNSIGRTAFSSCMSLTNVEMVCAATVIPYGTFYGCDNLSSVVLPPGLMEIGDRAFATTSGSNIEEMRFPASLKSICRTAFAYQIRYSTGQGWSGIQYRSGSPKNVLFYGDCPTVFAVADAQDVGYGDTIFHARTDPIYVTEGTSGWVAFGGCPLGGTTSIGMVDVEIMPGKVERSESSETVTLSCINDDAVLFYTLDGSDPATNATDTCFQYSEPFQVDACVTIKAHACVPNYPYTIIRSTNINFVVQEPVVVTEDCNFGTVSQSVSFTCATEGATLYYTIDGSEPSATNGRVYKGPFDIYQTTTVKAIAVKDAWKDSAVASATFTKENGLSEAINLLDVLPDNDKSHPWMVDTDVSHDGVSSARSGAIEDEESTTVKVVLYGAGRLSFWWKTQCEEPYKGNYYDCASFSIGSSEPVARLAGDSGWVQFVTNITDDAKHTFKWTYSKDDSGTVAQDCLWLDRVQWLSAEATDENDHTLTTETPVPYTWLDKYGLGRMTDFESAAKSKSGKCDGSGRELTVEEEYIAGTDPTNAASRLQAFVDLSEGFPNVTWKPDLNENGTKAIRTYKIWGKEALDGGAVWEYPTNSLHHFFKVTVEMP